jgi:hypothetical protein
MLTQKPVRVERAVSRSSPINIRYIPLAFSLLTYNIFIHLTFTSYASHVSFSSPSEKESYLSPSVLLLLLLLLFPSLRPNRCDRELGLSI